MNQTDHPANSGRTESGGFSVKRLVPVALIVIAAGLFIAFDLHKYLSLDALREHRQVLLEFYAKNQALTVIAFIAGYATVVALSIPGAIWMTLLSGFLFGTWVGTAVVVVAATLGALAIFLAARYAMGDILERKAGPFIKGMEAGFQENAFSYLMFLRLVPAFPFWLVNLVPAFLNVSTGVFVLATVLGIAPATAVFNSVGSGLGARARCRRNPEPGHPLRTAYHRPHPGPGGDLAPAHRL